MHCLSSITKLYTDITKLYTDGRAMTDETRPRYVQLLLPGEQIGRLQIRISAEEGEEDTVKPDARRQEENQPLVEVIVTQFSLDGGEHRYTVLLNDDANILRPSGQWKEKQGTLIPLPEEGKEKLWKVIILMVLGIHAFVEAALSYFGYL